MEIYLIRHTRPDVPEGLCYGRRDVPLDEAAFARALPSIVRHLPRGMVFYSSPASRCLRLAQQLVSLSGGSLAGEDARLHELDFGHWEGQLWHELPREETEVWTQDIAHYAPPGGEAYMTLWTRVTAFYQDILNAAAARSDARIAIVGHAGSLKVLLLRALKMGPGDFGLIDIAQGRVTRLDVKRTAEGEWFERVMSVNR
jgi:alpha-ribazole phosphatase